MSDTRQQLKWGAARMGGFVLHHTGLLRLCETVNRRRPEPRIAILYYHRVSKDRDGPWGMAVSPDHFRDQMAYLAGSRYGTISLERAWQHLSGETPLDQDAVVVTFDDGYRDNYAAAFPILEEFGIPATIFLATGAIDNQTPLWWDRLYWALAALRRQKIAPGALNGSLPETLRGYVHQALVGNDRRAAAETVKLVSACKRAGFDERMAAIETLTSAVDADPPADLMLTWDMVRAMDGDLVSFGAHTVNHPLLSEITSEQALAEMVESKDRIEEMAGHPVSSFAYPDGDTGLPGHTAQMDDVKDRVVGQVRDCGFTSAVTCENGPNRRGAHPLLMKRYGMVSVPAHVLALRLSGLLEAKPLRKRQ